MLGEKIKWVLCPVVVEAPFFIMMAMLLDYRAFYWLAKSPMGWLDDWQQYSMLRFVSISLVYSFILTNIVYYTRKKLVKYLFYVFAVLLLCIDVILFLTTHSIISPNSLLLLSETNWDETRGFLQSYLYSIHGLLTLFFFVGLLLVCCLAEKLRSRWLNLYKHLSPIIKKCSSCILVIFLLGGLFSFRYYYELFQCDTIEEADDWSNRSMKNADQITNIIFCFYDLNLAGNVLAKAVYHTKLVKKSHSQLIWPDDSLDVVLVIGESYSKYHSSLYGYSLTTNPRLEREKNDGRLFVYTDAVSPFIYTSEAVRNMLSTNSIGDGEQWYDNPLFPAIFRQAGYKVLFWDNQYDITSAAPYDYTLNAYLHDSEIATLSYDAQRPYVSMHDADLVADYQHYCAGHQINNPTFTIFHLQGQHFSTEERYPQTAEFHYFTVDSIRRTEEWMTTEKKQEIAHYDNCTLYNDYVMDQILTIFRDKCSVLVYLSDHGEDIYDTGDNLGRKVDSKQCYEIPFMIWCSDKYKEKHAGIVEYIQKSVDKPLMSDNLCHLLMRLGGVKSDYYHETRDVLSSQYECPSRIVANRIDYDKYNRY